MREKNNVQMLMVALISATLSLGVAYLIWEKDEKKEKPQVTAETLVKAEIQVGLLDFTASQIAKQKKSIELGDSSQARKHNDSLGMALNIIINNVKDSTRNPILYAK